MNEIIFEKYSGAGNDFVLIDLNKNDGVELSEKLITRICDRRFGVGADGVLAVSTNGNADFNLDYFNADGTGGMLCGNGARCVLHYAYQNFLDDSLVADFTCAGKYYQGRKIDENIFEYKMDSPDFIYEDFSVKLLGRKLTGFFAYTGANHYVVEFEQVADLFKLNEMPFDKFNVSLFGSEIRNAAEFLPEGTNVNFVFSEKGVYYNRTFEKGVEAETLACGTGSTAAAIFLALKYNLNPPINIITKSGRELAVSFERNDKLFTDVKLSGPAERIFKGIFKV